MKQLEKLPLLILLFLFGCQAKVKKVDAEKKIPKTFNIECYARQFEWTVRFAGKDDVLGETDIRLVSDQNIVGLVTTELMNDKEKDLNRKLDSIGARRWGALLFSKKELRLMESWEKGLDAIRKMKEASTNKNYSASYDDIIVQKEIHLPVVDTINVFFRSRDVIHGAYFPHFKTQVNCVPGITNRLKFSIGLTTEEMRKRLDYPYFDYMLLCNNICGPYHFQMQMKIVVESREDFEKWLGTQKAVGAI